MNKKWTRVFMTMVLMLLAMQAWPAQAAPVPRAVISKTSLVIDLAKGNTYRLTARVLPSSAKQDVVWLSKNPQIAAVKDGRITAKKVGRVQVGVRPAGVKRWSVCTITVKDGNAPTSMLLSQTSATLAVGETLEMSATLKPAGASQDVIWASNKSGVASVTKDGVITAKKPGTALIRCTSSRKSALKKTMRVRVVAAVAPNKLVITPGDKAMQAGETLRLSVEAEPAQASASVAWSSSDSKVVAVNNTGLVKAMGEGTARITARSKVNTKVYTVRSITVTDKAKPASVEIRNADQYLAPGESVSLQASVLPATAPQAVNWSSSRESVATVSSSGKVTAKGSGNATIVARAGDQTDSITVTVIEDERVTVVPSLTTSLSGIPANLAKIDAIRLSAYAELEALVAKGDISANEKNVRKNILVEAFAMYRFPWMTENRVLYWKGGSYYNPGVVYFGMPYTQTNRTYNVTKLLSQGYFTKKGTYYGTAALKDKVYPGNDCSSFVSMSNFGTNSSVSYLNSDAMRISPSYATIPNGFGDLRPGDTLVKSGHVVMFLYYTNAARNSIMVIEQGGGAEPNLVACRIRALSYYANSGAYIVRRRSGLKTT